MAFDLHVERGVELTARVVGQRSRERAQRVASESVEDPPVDDGCVGWDLGRGSGSARPG
jgi:hypothetical protein